MRSVVCRVGKSVSLATGVGSEASQSRRRLAPCLPYVGVEVRGARTGTPAMRLLLMVLARLCVGFLLTHKNTQDAVDVAGLKRAPLSEVK
jgi:hypothetical protein